MRRIARPGALGTALFLSLATTARSQAVDHTPPAAPRALGSGFVENVGQWPTTARFVARHGALTLRAEPDGLALQLAPPDRETGALVRIAFDGAERRPPVVGIAPRAGRRHYFVGDETRWRRDVRTYDGLRYVGLYDGIDLAVYENEDGALEYDVIVAPGASLYRFAARCIGAAGLAIEDDTLVIHTDAGTIRMAAPRAWERTPNGRRPVTCHYRRIGRDGFGFAVPDHSDEHTLVIDPVLYCSYLGGSSVDQVNAMAVAPNGSVTILGSSNSADFPTTPGAYRQTRFGSQDIVVAQFDGAGNLAFATYLGGSSFDYASALQRAATGDVFIGGSTRSPDYPTTVGAFDTTFNGGTADAVVTILSADGSRLVYSTFLGGSGLDGVGAIDPGRMTVAGSTDSGNFPTTAGAYDTTANGGDDAFVTRFASGGATLAYSTFIGGTRGDGVSALVADPSGAVTIAGNTDSSDFPTTSGVYGPTAGGGLDGFVARLGPAGSSLTFSSYFGGPQDESIGALRIAPNGALTISGFTQGGLPTTPGAFDTGYNGSGGPYGGDGYVAQLGAGAIGLVWSTYLGGSGDDIPLALDVRPSGAVVVAGGTTSADFPTTPGAFDPSRTGTPSDGFVSVLGPTGDHLVYSSYFGTANAYESIRCVDASRPGELIIAGDAQGGGLPTTPGAADPTYNGGHDIFVARLGIAAVTPAGPVRPGTSVALRLEAGPRNGGLRFQAGTALGTGPIPLGSRRLHLSPDGLLMLSTSPAAPAWFGNYGGILNATGNAVATLAVPSFPALIGIRVHTAFVTLDPAASLGIREISATTGTTIVP